MQYISFKTLTPFSTPTRRRMPEESPPHVGLMLGGYENHQRNLRAQAKQEYNSFLAKQVKQLM